METVSSGQKQKKSSRLVATSQKANVCLYGSPWCSNAEKVNENFN